MRRAALRRAIRRRLRVDRYAAIAIASASAWIGGAADAAAQARTVVTPAVSVAAAYDDNVLWQPVAEADHVWRISPDVSFTRDTPTASWLGSAAVDGEWYDRYRNLSTPAARQHADLTGRWTTSPRLSIDVTTNYDNSISPADLNLATGLVPGRLRAWRWLGGPEATYAVTTSTKLTAQYQLTGEFAEATPGVFTHEGDFGVTHAIDARDELRARYIGQVFAFEGASTVISHTGLLGWTRTLTPAVQLRVDAGPRHVSARTRPEIDAGLTRHTTFSDASIDYTWTETTALGLAELVEVQRVLGSWQYTGPGRFSVSAQGGLYRNDFGTDQATIYSAAVDVVIPLFSVVSLGMSYAIDDQRLQPGAFPVTPVTFAPDVIPDILPPTLAGPERIRRSLTLVRFIFAGSIRSASGPGPETPGGGGQPTPRRPE